MKHFFTKEDFILWGGSCALILIAYFVFGGDGILTLVASILGATSLIFSAKGNPIGQLLMVIFSVLYGVISWSFRYYGEMLTYLGMTMPMAVVALISWLKNPYEGNRAQVKVARLHAKEWGLLAVLTVAVTMMFYFVLRAFHTQNLLLSTISVATSFAAVYLTFRRSPYYALGYAANDLVLIVLWILAAVEDVRYVSVVVCFAIFLVNDLYGFICWTRMARQQHAE